MGGGAVVPSAGSRGFLGMDNLVRSSYVAPDILGFLVADLQLPC
jgi:hypothetical protein